MLLGEQDVTGVATRRRREAGIGFIPEDRHRHGLLLDSPLWENRILGHQTRPPNVKGVLIDRQGARRDTERIVARVRRAYARHRRHGGVAVRRQPAEADRRPGDVRRARSCSSPPIRRAASTSARSRRSGTTCGSARADGLAVLLISADLDELIGMSDTLQVILRGRLVGEADPATITPDQLGSLMTGAGEGSAA